MSQYPPYQPGPYSDPTASSHSGGSQRSPYAPGPPYGPGGAPFIPPPVFVIPPPSPEETANRSRRTTRGLALGGVILRSTCGATIDVCYVGKACTFVLMAGFAVVLLGLFPVPGLGLVDAAWLPGFGSEPASLGMWAIYVGCLLSLCAAIIYTGRGARALRSHLIEKRSK